MTSEEVDKISEEKGIHRYHQRHFKRHFIPEKAAENKKNLVNIKIQYQNRRKA